MPITTFPLGLVWKNDGPLLSVPSIFSGDDSNVGVGLPRGNTNLINTLGGWTENENLDEPFVYTEELDEGKYFVRSRRATLTGLPSSLPDVINSIKFNFTGTIDQVADPTWGTDPNVRIAIIPSGSDVFETNIVFKLSLGRAFTSAGDGPYFGTWLRPDMTEPWPFSIHDYLSVFSGSAWNDNLDLSVSIGTQLGFVTDTIQTCQHSVTISNFSVEMVVDYEGVIEETTASFTATVDPSNDLQVNFDASSSYSPGGSITSYSWDFGDSSSEITSEPEISHVYPAYSTYLASLTVTDDDDLTDSVNQFIEVFEPVGPLEPDANFSITVDGATILLDASASFDPDGFITSYVWDFGDGNSGTGVMTSHTYTANGEYTVTLTVTDNDDISFSWSENANIYVTSQPTAMFSTVIDDLTVTFDPFASYDPDGPIDIYFWDFGDGATVFEAYPTHTYSSYGTYTVTLTVTDGQGDTDSISREIVLGESRGITWLEPGSKTYERGVDRGVLYMDDGRVVPWNGLTGVDEDLGRSSDSVYFDGSKLSEVVNPDGFSANVTAISYPKQLEEVYGNRPLRRGFYLGGQTPKTFGFAYRTKLGTDLVEDAGYKLHIIYNILAVPEGRTFQTISEEPNVTEFSWNFRTTPEALTGYRASAYLVIDSTRVTPSLLVEIESILYGTPTTPPRLPPLQEFIQLINDFNNFINIVDNGDGTWEANTLIDGVINDLGDGIFEIQHANIQWTSPNSYLISPTPDPP